MPLVWMPNAPIIGTSREQAEGFRKEQEEVAPEQNPDGDLWQPGSGPSQVQRWSVQALAKAGTLGIIGVYPPNDSTFPIGLAMNRNITVRMGNCNHRKYIPQLVSLVRSGKVNPTDVITRDEPMGSVIEAYEAFDKRQPGWLKVKVGT